MKVVTGGRYNGKLEYVTEELGFSGSEILDLGNTDIAEALSVMKDHPVLYHLEAFIKKAIPKEIDFNAVIESYVQARPDCVIVCDEVGSGIVPVKREDDEWREAVGRIMCRLACKAGGITRITYGVAEEIRYGM